ncbi:MAG: mechanosensitive ion channel family protein [Thiohalobacterales bacterium]
MRHQCQILFLFLLLTLPSAQAEERYPLEPVDTSSPRATLTGFLSNVDAVWKIYRDVYWHSPGRSLRDRITITAADALRTLDLSEVAPSARVHVGYDAATHLYETLSRIELPPIEEIPDAAFYAGVEGPVHWTVPHTDITISRIMEGPRKGEFLFTAATVRRSGEFYQKVRSLPYTRNMPIQNSNKLRQVLPGWWVSMTTIERLPGWSRAVVLDHAIWKWIASVLVLAALVVLLAGVHRLTQRNLPDNPVRGYLRRLLIPLVVLLINPFVAYVLTEQVNLIGTATKSVLLISETVEYLVATWVAWLGSLLLAELIILSPRIENDSLNAQLLRLTVRIMGIVLGVIIIFYGANQIGLPIVGVLAGVGVGGLAIALAAQDSLKNLLGSLMIFMDQPYKPGQRIVVQGHDGFVEQIGLRSTKIRMLTGALTAIPNEKMASMDVENIGRRNFIRRQTSLRLANDTPVEQVEKAISVVKEILEDHEGMQPKFPPRVFFDEFNPDSLNILVSYWYHPPRRWMAMAFDEKVNLDIMRRFAAEKIRLACPTSRTLLAQESGQSLHFASSDGNKP